MNEPVLLSLGSINADFQMQLDRPLGSAETPPADRLMRMSGGKAANRTFIARRLGLRPASDPANLAAAAVLQEARTQPLRTGDAVALARSA